jgi:hypothetical protein
MGRLGNVAMAPLNTGGFPLPSAMASKVCEEGNDVTNAGRLDTQAVVLNLLDWKIAARSATHTAAYLVCFDR